MYIAPNTLEEEFSPARRRLVPASGREAELRVLLANLSAIQGLANGRAALVSRDRAGAVDRAVEAMQEQALTLAINLGLLVEQAA